MTYDACAIRTQSPGRTPTCMRMHLLLPRTWNQGPRCQSASAEHQPGLTPCLANTVSPLVMVSDKAAAAASDMPSLAKRASRCSRISNGPSNLRQDVIKGALDVHEDDCDGLPTTSCTIEQHLDGHRWEVRSAGRHRTVLEASGLQRKPTETQGPSPGPGETCIRALTLCKPVSTYKFDCTKSRCSC